MKLIINFGENDLSFEGGVGWCKKAFERLTDAIKKPKHDCFTFTNVKKIGTTTVRLSCIKFFRLEK